MAFLQVSLTPEAASATWRSLPDSLSQVVVRAALGEPSYPDLKISSWPVKVMFFLGDFEAFYMGFHEILYGDLGFCGIWWGFRRILWEFIGFDGVFNGNFKVFSGFCGSFNDCIELYCADFMIFSQPSRNWDLTVRLYALRMGLYTTKSLSRRSLGGALPWWLTQHEIPSGKRLRNYGKSPFFMGKSTISMAIFNSYVSLPEGSHVLEHFCAFKTIESPTTLVVHTCCVLQVSGAMRKESLSRC